MKKLMLYIAALFFILYNTVISQENNFKFNKLAAREGLSQNWIRCIYQDSHGFMWFGADNGGLNRYDGYNFKVYEHNSQNSNTVANNRIYKIIEDRNKNLIVGTRGGINIYDRKKDLFKEFPILKGKVIIDLLELGNGKIICVADEIIYLINPDNMYYRKLCLDNDGECIDGDFLTGAVKDKYNNIWVGSSDGLWHVDTTNNIIISFDDYVSNSKKLTGKIITSLYIDRSRRMWVGSRYNGIDIIEYKKGTNNGIEIKTLRHNPDDIESISEGEITTIYNDIDGNIWIGTENGGMNFLSSDDNKNNRYIFNHILQDSYEKSSISSNSIRSIYQDNAGAIWIGTFNGGISYYNKLLYKFDFVKPVPDNTNSLNNPFVNVFLEIGGDLLIGTEGGLNIFNQNNKKFKQFTYKETDKNSIGSNAVWSIFKDKEDNIWIGTWAGGLNLFDPGTGTFKRFQYKENDANSIASNNIFGIQEDDEGNLWLGCMNGGLTKFNYRKNTFKTYPQAENGQGTTSTWIRTLLYNSYKELWISNTNSVQILNTKTDIFTTFRNISGDTTSISYDGAIVFFEDSKRNMWIGTEGGLDLYHRDNGAFSCYFEKDGLPNNVIKGICEDNGGNLWISTNKGISKFIKGADIPDNPEFINFDMSDGLQDNEFNRRACFRDKHGNIYFGGINGYNVFNPEEIKLNTKKPKIVFTDFLLFNIPAEIGTEGSPLKTQINFCDTLILSYKQSVFTIRYAALNYIATEKNKYAYILEGFEKSWNFVGQKREATYTNLNPGTYTFRVIAANNDDIWNTEGKKLKVIVLPPWYKTWLFRIIFFLVLISSVVGFYLIRVNNLKKQKEYLKKLVKQRTIEIEVKNAVLTEKSDKLNRAIKLLEENQEKVLNQSEQLQMQKNELEKMNNELSETNTLLEERQQRIEEQSEELRAQAEDLAQANKELDGTNKTKDKFFSIIAHDLKNPFNTVLGFSQLLMLKKDIGADKRDSYISSIYDSSKRIFSLLENLLQWSRMQTNRIAFKPKKFKLYKIIDNEIALLKENANEKEIHIISDIDKNVEVEADQDMIGLVVRNLISNAIKFTGRKGKIKVSSKIIEKMVIISVNDNGVGIAEYIIADLFKIEKNTSSSGTEGEEGTGLGLLLCKEFIEKNKGELWVESEEGKGSTFYFTIPVP